MFSQKSLSNCFSKMRCIGKEIASFSRFQIIARYCTSCSNCHNRTNHMRKSMLLPNKISSVIHGKFRNFQRNHFSTLSSPLESLLNKLPNSSFWTVRRGWLRHTSTQCSARHPLLCVTMASSGFAAIDRQLCHPLVAASSPGYMVWLQGPM